MKYLKKYNVFKEAVLDISQTDMPDVKMGKQSLENLGKQLTEYKTKKVQIDNIYRNYKDPVEIEKELVKILGDQQVKDGPDRNPYLVDYLHLAKLKSDLDNFEKQNKNYQEELKLAVDSASKQSVNQKIQELMKKVNETKTKLTFDEKTHKDKMSKTEAELKINISKLSNV
jgi:hypothetical protein